MARTEHKGNARKATLASDISAGDLTITGDDLSGWPDGSVGLFWGALNKDTPSEEKVLFVSRSGNVLTVFSDAGGNGRGRDDTVAQAHQTGATLEHVWTATEASAASAHQETGSGAHGYPPVDSLVLLTGAQTLSEKTLTAPVIEGGEVDQATHVKAHLMKVIGDQPEAEFRVRNTYIGVGPPANTLGNDGDLYIEKA